MNMKIWWMNKAYWTLDDINDDDDVDVDDDVDS